MKEKIISLLKEHPEGLTIQDISNELKVHRQTATKYLFYLEGANLIWRREVGSATLHYLKITSRSANTLRAKIK